MTDIDKTALLNLCDDLHQVKGNISQLQATLNQVLLKAPNLDEYEELIKLTNVNNFNVDNRDLISIYERVTSYINSPHVKIAARLKYLYKNGYLPLLLALTKINFKSLNSDKFVGYFLDYTPSIPKDIPEPLMKSLDSSKLKVNSVYPPSLPPISDILLIRVLTDKSYRKASDFIELSKLNDFSKSHNGKLHFKGKQLINLILTQIIDEKFPNIEEEDLVYLLRKCLEPIILTKFAFGYNLIDPFRYNLSNEIDVADKLEIFKKIFLAYIGGLSSDGYSFQEITIWIKKLYQPIIDSLEAPSVYNEAILTLNLFLKSFAGAKEIQAKYEQIELDPFVAKLSINDDLFCMGTDSSSFERAKSKAAYSLLNDSTNRDKLLSVIYEQYLPTYEQLISPIPAGNEIPMQPVNEQLSPEGQLFYFSKLLFQYNMFAKYIIRKLANDYMCTIIVRGIEIGSGIDNTKKSALEKATSDALNNPSGLKLLGITL